ncbi:unnamed protein product [Rangifer tarandus platyrhynchus]|uniref:Uncharacterized protein n=1 Tax=Rangifer tarandus platyrhynchus TaxID=3082113 RepID=A0AC59ZRT7_RANTA
MGGSARNPGVLQRDDSPSQSPYQRLSQRMLDISGDRGVLKDVIREGAGELVTPDASVLVKYSGYLEHMDKPFDSNCFRRTPRLMKLGEDITLWGMELGLLSMRRGELARFLFKPTYAYGTLGCPPLIPPNTTVLFEIELLDFLDSAESDKFCALSAEQQGQFPLQKVLKVAATEREFGNYLFRQNRFSDAKMRYKRALMLLRRRTAPAEEQHLVETAKLLVFLNLSFTYLKLERPTMALRYGEQALIIDQKNAKALFRCGQACLLMTEYQKARDFLVRAQREQPFNHDINNELKKLASYYRDYMDKEREMCHRMFAPAQLRGAAPLKPGRGAGRGRAEGPPLGVSTRRPAPRLVAAAPGGGACSGSAAVRVAAAAAAVAARRLLSLRRLPHALPRAPGRAGTHAAGSAMARTPRRGERARGRRTARPE